MVRIDTLVSDLQSALCAPYVSPGSIDLAKIHTQGVDCSGLICACFRHQGASIYHGSNTIWRSYLTEKGSIKGTGNAQYKQTNARTASQLEVGMAIFKWNPNTPSKFSDGDGDYQHVGVVVSVKPLKIIHASTDGMKVKQDTSIGKWCAWGKMKSVQYDTKSETTQESEGTAMAFDKLPCVCRVKTSGGALNVRESANGKKIGQFPNGEDVVCDAVVNQWAHCTLNDVTGWCSTQYLVYLCEADDDYLDDDDGVSVVDFGEDDPNIIDSFDDVAAWQSDAEAVMEAHTDQISAIYKALYKAGIMKQLPHYSNGALEV